MGQWISKRIPPPEVDPPSDQPQVLNDTLSANDMMKQDVMAGLSLVPDAGSFLTILVSFLWPEDGTDMWDQIAAGVKTICEGLINEQMSKDLADKTQGLYALMDDYRQTEYGLAQKGEKLTFILSWFIANKPSYMNQAQPWLTMQYFVPMATLNLTALREQWLYWDKIYPQNQGAATSQHLIDLHNAMAEYVKAANDIKTQCLAWRNGHVTISDWERSIATTWPGARTVTDDIRGISHTITFPRPTGILDPTPETQLAICNAQANKYYQNLLDYVDQVYRQQIDDLLSPSLQWPYFDNTGPTPVIKEPVRTTTGTMCSGLSQYMVHFNHRAFRDQHGPITRIVLYGGDWVSGIEVFYGGESSGLQGKANDAVREMDISSTEYIAYISGNVSDKLDALELMVNPGKWTGAGLQVDPSKFAMLPTVNFFIGGMAASNDPLAFVDWRLDYIFGWSNPVDGRIEQFGAVFAHDESPNGNIIPFPTSVAPAMPPTNISLGSTGMAGVDNRHEAAKLKRLGGEAREKVMKGRLAKEKMVK